MHKGDIAMDKPYVAPELLLAGEAEEVVLGMGTSGHDMFGEFQTPGEEFQTDESVTTER